MNKKIFYHTLAIAIVGWQVVLYSTSDPRTTRDITIDIDTTLTTCCATMEANFVGTFTEITALNDLGQESFILIKQVDVGVTGYTITTSGVYKLSENIVFSPVGAASAITISVDNVILDLQCFSIAQGNATANVTGITLAAGIKNIILENGSIVGMSGAGLVVGAGCSNIVYSKSSVQACTYGMLCNGTTLAPVTLVHVTELDFLANGTGLSWNNVVNSYAADCFYFENSSAGIELVSSFTNTIQGSIINNTGGLIGSAVGVSLVGGGYNKVARCTIDGVSTSDTFSGNSAVGILIGATENDDTLINNQISNVTTTSNAQPFGIEMLYTITSLDFITSVSGGGFGDFEVAWSPNGRFVAGVPLIPGASVMQVFEYVEGRLKLVATSPSGGGSDIIGIGWSPDGQFLATVYANDSTLRVFKFSGSELKLFATAPGLNNPQTTLQWSHDGKYLAAGFGSSVSNAQLFKFSNNGTSGILTLIDQINGFGNLVVWSPDDKYLAVADNNNVQARVYSFNGNVLSLVATYNAPFMIESINWAPNGQNIVISYFQGIAILQFTGSVLNLVSITSTPSRGWANWSPDGKYIVESSVVIPSVLLYKFLGNGLQLVASNGVNSNERLTPQWSPNGGVIAASTDAQLATIIIYTGFQFPTGNTILNNQISNIFGPALPAGQPGVSSGRGISASSANNLIIQNTVFDADLSYVFVNNVYEQFIANASPVPSLLSNISFPPL